MTPQTLQDQLIKYLTDAHAIEQQAIAQLQMAPRIAVDDQLKALFTDHLRESEEHRRLVEARLQAHGASPSAIKGLAGKVTGQGFGLFAAAQPDTAGKLVVHAFSYEHMEEAAYELLRQLATLDGDGPTAEIARWIGQQEHGMGQRLEESFDRAVDASIDEDAQGADLNEQLEAYLEDMHAIETQSLNLLDKASNLAGDPELAIVYADHRNQTEAHRETIASALQARGGEPSRLKDAALRLGALNWAAFFGAQPDTPAKLAAFVYAVEHLEIGAYETLKRVAARAGESEVLKLANAILAEEYVAAKHIWSLFGHALEAGLHANIES